MKKFLVTILTIVMAASMLLTACGSKEPATLEEAIANSSDIQQEFDEAVGSAAEQGVTVDVKGNQITYNFDLASMDGVTEELAKSDTLKTSLEEALNGQGDTFKNIAANMSEATDIEGISVVVNYMYGDEVIVTSTFTQD